jgi:3-dehydroquinate dehydratase-2
MRKVLVLNGPNLSLLGSREPEVYGLMDLSAMEVQIAEVGAEMGLEIDFRQTDSESVMVGWIHEAASQKTDVVINPAAFTHYSYALRDACAHLTKSGLKLIEVHISNPHAREQFRHTSVISGAATGVIAGLGVKGYLLALGAIV